MHPRMGSFEDDGGSNRSVFDGSVRVFRPATTTTTLSSGGGAAISPETLMAEIDAAISAHEHAHATALLLRHQVGKTPPADAAAAYDSTGLAEEAYKAACAALAAGKPEAALRSLRVALASCPPEKASAVSKLRSLLSFATAQHQRSLLLRHHHKSSSPP